MWEYALWELAVIAAIYLVAGIVKGGIGLGLPTVSIGLMAAWLPVEQAASPAALHHHLGCEPQVVPRVTHAVYHHRDTRGCEPQLGSHASSPL